MYTTCIRVWLAPFVDGQSSHMLTTGSKILLWQLWAPRMSSAGGTAYATTHRRLLRCYLQSGTSLPPSTNEFLHSPGK